MSANITEQTSTNLIKTLEAVNLTDTEHQRIQTEKQLKKRLLEIQSIYDEREAIRKQALKIYNDNKITMSTFINGGSFSRPTLYADRVLKQIAEFLIKQSSSRDNKVKLQKAIDAKHETERFNQALVDDVIELLHLQDEVQLLTEQVESLKRENNELKAHLGVKPNVIPLDVRKKREPSIEGDFPVNLHRD